MCRGGRNLKGRGHLGVGVLERWHHVRQQHAEARLLFLCALLERAERRRAKGRRAKGVKTVQTVKKGVSSFAVLRGVSSFAVLARRQVL